MTQQQSNDLWLEDILREEMPYVSDEGFTKKILEKVETRNKTRARFSLLLWMISGSGLVYIIFNYLIGAPSIKIDSLSQFLVQTLTTTPSLGVVATGSFIVMLLIVLTKTEV